MGRYKGKPLFRAFVSKALNRLIQGSAEDQAKQAMVNAYEAGFDMRLPVHDEINAMVSNKQEANQLATIMEEAIPLNVPVESRHYRRPNPRANRPRALHCQPVFWKNGICVG